jgi:cytochrome bd ubiquinol oxidase subunit I
LLSVFVAASSTPSQLLPARSQMAFTLGIHIVLVPFGVAFVRALNDMASADLTATRSGSASRSELSARGVRGCEGKYVQASRRRTR